MDEAHYLDIFKKAATGIDNKLLKQKHIEVAVGMHLDSVFLKLYKTAWANKFPDPLTAESRIFFSIWINDKAIKESRILYNIHALKLRKLKGYKLESREFATAFRTMFKDTAHEWPNVSVNYGPLTLMEGWKKIDLSDFEDDILKLALQFLEIDYFIDELLESRRIPLPI